MAYDQRTGLCVEHHDFEAGLHFREKHSASRERRAKPRHRPRASADFVVVTGLSGSGKSHAIRALEDLGYFCVDNLPLALIPTFADLTLRAPGGVRRAAVVVDVREGRALATFPAAYRRLKKNAGSHQVRLVFLDAGHSTLLRRFSETRRPHPLAMNRTVDLVIAGGTSDAVAAALEARRNGFRVLIVCRELAVPVGRVRGAGRISVMDGAEVVCVDGVGAPEAVVVRELRSGRLIGVNTSQLLRFP